MEGFYAIGIGTAVRTIQRPYPRPRQVQTYPWRRDPARWDESQSGTRQAGLVLVVSEVCTGGYGAGRARDRSAEGEERLVGRSAADAAVGVAEKVRTDLCLSFFLF